MADKDIDGSDIFINDKVLEDFNSLDKIIIYTDCISNPATS